VISVLYVDDEPALLELTRLFLERYGNYSVDTAISALDALDMMKAAPYDAIISDYQMPVMDGIALLKHLRAEDSSTPFILFTGRGREEIAIEALNAGADFYLQKGGEPGSLFAELEHKLRLAVERRRIADELSESRQRMTAIVSHLPDATFAIDLEGKVIVWNRAMEEMTGVKEEEILGTGDHACAAAIYRARRPILLDFIIGREEKIREYYPDLTVKDDRLITENYIPTLYGGRGAHVWLVASPLYDAHGTITGAIESIRDITDRKLAEEALHRSEEKYRTLTEQTNDIIYLMDVNGRLTHIGPQVARYGYTPEEIISQNLSVFVVEEDVAIVVDDLEKAIATGIPRYTVFRARDKSGNIYWFEDSGAPVFDENGVIVGVSGVLRDITDRRRIEQKLVESERIYRSILENMRDVFYRSDREGILIMVSPSGAELLGYGSVEELLGKKIDSTLYADRGEQDRFLAEMDKRGEVVNYRVILKRRDGSPIPVETSSRRYYDENGCCLGIEGFFRSAPGPGFRGETSGEYSRC